MARRTCNSCGKPLGSTRGKCHDCGGETFRGDRSGSTFQPVGGISHWFRRLVGRRVSGRSTSEEDPEPAGADDGQEVEA